ncbi:glycosyltransferase family 9 protein [uncultured Tenacibaculum sp.]|uniref:glycosyltransferase family 9 protein n=1 Tax=uncultured Tenacibaculum sp. TaxID=174713 RepID=UPI00262DB5C0|nr:glycosyltransferase family 9 protein [uncultured Tenacibaculum sp.]
MSLKNKHILIIRLSAMGDVAMTVPVIRNLIKQNKGVKITILTRAFFTPFFTEFDNVTVYTPELKGKHKGIIGLFKLFKELIKLNIDVVADLHNVIRSNILVSFFRLRGIKCVQLKKGRKDKKKLTELNENKILFSLKTMHERYADVFKKLGFSMNLSSIYNLVKKEIPYHFQKEFNDSKLIGIAPFAAYKGKAFPIKKIKSLVKELSDKNYCKVLLFGGGDVEKKLLEDLAKDYTNVFSMVKKGTFEEELNIISNLDVMISMDSGNGHIAAMYNVPVITIWGVTHPCLGFTPFNQSIENQILPDLREYPLIPTSTYGKEYPKEYLNCFETILISDIIKVVNTYTK